MRGAELDRIRRHPIRLTDVLARLVELAQDFLDRWAEALAGRRQGDRLDPAVEQPRGDPFLKALDPPAEGRLRRVTQIGRAGKIPRVDETEEILQPFDFHRMNFRNRPSILGPRTLVEKAGTRICV